ncbi:MAG: hypothetical protein QOD65_3341 [Gaiellales bacterium]|nr:hypothetical protein [Gaiellales bacterium]
MTGPVAQPPGSVATEVSKDVARRSLIVALGVIAVLAVLLPAGAAAATAPAAAPVLTSPPFATLVSFHWTPGNGLNTSQAVYRSVGPCATPVSTGQIQGSPYGGNLTTDFVDNVIDGVYCYYIQAADLISTANSPGLTVIVDTHDPAATIAIPNASATGTVSGTVALAATSADAASGVASSVLHIGASGACRAGLVMGTTWDTTSVANGAYDVCNVVTDNAGRVAVATITVTVANVAPVPPAAPVAPPAALPADKKAPGAPRNLSAGLPRAKAGAKTAHVTLHWVNPKAHDLDHVIVVLNLKRAPTGPADGSLMYSGLGNSAVLRLRAGRSGYVALFAYDHSDNVSRPARKRFSTGALIPLRPLSGSVVDAAPHLTWTPKKGSAYYNVQLFRNGRRVLIAWPSQASYDVPQGKLAPGTYVWFVWPAVKSGGAAPKFADLIGRATFVVKA